MPKLKTKKGAVKRFRITKQGKIKYATCGKSHLLTGKETKRLRHMRRSKAVEGKKDIKYLRRMLPYG